jgi:transcriptional regulator with XRE-family HTH domain
VSKETILGNRLRELRTALGLTLFDLSKATSISYSHIRRIEKGERFPSARTLRKLAGSLSCEESELLILGHYISETPKEPVYEPEGPIDPLVVRILSREPVEVQQAVVALAIILKAVAGCLRNNFREA